LSAGLPGGASALVTRGFLNLCHRESSTDPQPVPAGEWLDLALDLEATTWCFEPGHEIRLALARADWPNAWPAPVTSTMEVDLASVALDLPTADRPESPPPTFAAPVADDHGPHLDEEEPQPPTRWWVEHDVLGRRRTARDEHGDVYTGRHGSRIVDTFTGTVDVSTVDPADAGAVGTYRCELTWPEASVAVTTRVAVRSTVDEYRVEIDLDAEEDGAPFAYRRWREVIPRRLQ
jgi:hypothetical protein